MTESFKYCSFKYKHIRCHYATPLFNYFVPDINGRVETKEKKKSAIKEAHFHLFQKMQRVLISTEKKFVKVSEECILKSGML